jgi:FK506-binding nuclear protein
VRSSKVFHFNEFEVFDANGVIGWDIGLQGIQLGGERKIRIPAAAAYGAKAQAGIPSNSDLVFEVKCVSLD